MKPVQQLMVALLLLLSGTAHARPEPWGAYTYDDREMAVVVPGSRILAFYSFSDDAWTSTKTEEYRNKFSARKIELAGLDENGVTVFHITDGENITLDRFSRKTGKFAERAVIKAIEVGLPKFDFAQFGGVTKRESRYYMFTFPLARKACRVTRGGADITAVLGPGFELQHGRIYVNQLLKPVHSQAMGFTRDFAVAWVGCGKANHGLLYRFEEKTWEELSWDHHPDKDKPFGGLTPRGEFGHCFTGDRLFILGGHLTWSSAVGIPGGLPNMCYSVKEKKWRVLPERGGPENSRYSFRSPVCWTGSELLIGVGTTCYFYNPETRAWRQVKMKPGQYASGDFAVCVKKKVYLFSLNDREKGKLTVSVSIYDPAKDAWTLGKALAN